MTWASFLLITLFSFATFASGHRLEDYGGLEGVTGLDAGKANSEALEAAFLAANSSSTDRVVEIPQGSTYTVMSATIANMTDVIFKIDGLVSFMP